MYIKKCSLSINFYLRYLSYHSIILSISYVYTYIQEQLIGIYHIYINMCCTNYENAQKNPPKFTEPFTNSFFNLQMKKYLIYIIHRRGKFYPWPSPFKKDVASH